MRPGPIANVHGLPRLDKPMADVAKLSGVAEASKHSAWSCPVLLDGIDVRSMTEAAEIIGCTASAISNALRSGRTTVKGHEVRRVGGDV